MELNRHPDVTPPNVPKVSYYQPKDDSLLKPNIIPSFESIKLHFALLEGHLGVKEGVSETAKSLVGKLTDKAMIRLRGPSGMGKTKAIFDVLRKRFGVYVDFAADRVERDVSFFFKRLYAYKESRDKQNGYQEVFEDWCSYEFYLVIASRLVALMFLITRNRDFTPSDALHLQINGLAAGKYEKYLLKIRELMRRRYRQTSELKTLIETIYHEFKFVLCVDEINVAVGKMQDEFMSVTTNTKSRPLISLVIKRLGDLNAVPIIVSGTGRIQDQVDYFTSATARDLQSQSEVQTRTGRKFITIDLT